MTKSEIAVKLKNITRFGSVTSAEAANMTKEDCEEWGRQLSQFYALASDDESRDLAQLQRIVALKEAYNNATD